MCQGSRSSSGRVGSAQILSLGLLQAPYSGRPSQSTSSTRTTMSYHSQKPTKSMINTCIQSCGFVLYPWILVLKNFFVLLSENRKENKIKCFQSSSAFELCNGHYLSEEWAFIVGHLITFTWLCVLRTTFRSIVTMSYSGQIEWNWETFKCSKWFQNASGSCGCGAAHGMVALLNWLTCIEALQMRIEEGCCLWNLFFTTSVL